MRDVLVGRVLRLLAANSGSSMRETVTTVVMFSGSACSPPTSALIFLIILVIHDVLDQVLLNHFCAPPGDAGI